MLSDRRNPAWLELERRESARIPCFQRVTWRVENDHAHHKDWLVSLAETGFALLAEHAHAPAEGTRINYECPGGHDSWGRSAIVTRVDHVSAAMDLVAAKYVDTAEEEHSDETTEAALDQTTLPHRERRRSVRWKTTKHLKWRISRGRRIRESRVVERSLDGLVLMTSPGDAPQVGARFVPGDDHMAERFGFRSALVKRTESLSRQSRLVFVEIEA